MTVGQQATEYKPSDGSWGSERGFALAILATCVLGVLLRGLHLDVPMRYDETVTFLAYASKGGAYVTENYQNPNNHVFHSLLVAWSTGWLGGAPGVIRLPAFLAACLLVPASAWVAHRVYGREAALLAAMLVATSPLLIEFSVNARGYSLVTLSVVLAAVAGLYLRAGGGWIVWLAWIELTVMALYTIPTAVVPWLGLSGWLAGELARGKEPRRWPRALGPLAIASTLAAAVTLLLYGRILQRQGADALVANRFVTPRPASELLAQTPGEIVAIFATWSRGVPLVLLPVLVACLAVGLWPSERGAAWRRLLGSLLAATAVAMAVVRNWGEPRIWQWAVPLLAVTAAAGAIEVTRRIFAAPRSAHAAALAGGWGLLMSAYILWADPVGASRDTGASPYVPEVFDAIVEHYRPNDWLVGDFVSTEPLRYYLARWGVEHGVPPAADIERAWVVTNAADSVRMVAVRRLLARMGAPPLEELGPVATAGDLTVYLIGRPDTVPDLGDADEGVGVLR